MRLALGLAMVPGGGASCVAIRSARIAAQMLRRVRGSNLSSSQSGPALLYGGDALEVVGACMQQSLHRLQ